MSGMLFVFGQRASTRFDVVFRSVSAALTASRKELVPLKHHNAFTPEEPLLAERECKRAGSRYQKFQLRDLRRDLTTTLSDFSRSCLNRFAHSSYTVCMPIK